MYAHPKPWSYAKLSPNRLRPLTLTLILTLTLTLTRSLTLTRPLILTHTLTLTHTLPTAFWEDVLSNKRATSKLQYS